MSGLTKIETPTESFVTVDDQSDYMAKQSLDATCVGFKCVNVKEGDYK